MPQLLTLKGYSDSQDRIKKDVEQQNKMFDELVQEIQDGEFDYETAEQVFKRFGDPVYRREAEYEGQTLEQWLYRYAKDFSGDKVYIYFNGTGQLVNFEYVKGQKTNGRSV